MYWSFQDMFYRRAAPRLSARPVGSEPHGLGSVAAVSKPHLFTHHHKTFKVLTLGKRNRHRVVRRATHALGDEAVHPGI